jgi:hypothetical protein
VRPYAVRHPICCGFKKNLNMKRVCIYPKDLASIIGTSIRKAQYLMQNIRYVLKKEKHQCVSIRELAWYLGIDEDMIDLGTG